MHAKKRNGRFSLYRSHYVRKGADGNTHGYSKPQFVGSLRLDAQEIPPELAAKLSPSEVEYVNNTVVKPARQVAEQLRLSAEQERLAAEKRERDPRWRIEDALQLLTDSARLVFESGRAIDSAKFKALGAALENLAVAAKVQRDPLESVVAAVASATKAVRAGHYGKAPAGNLRDTSVYKKWRSIAEAVDDGDGSLLRALQATGWVRARG